MNLIISDFDGTFYDNNYIKNIEFIENLDNFDFIIATGRNIDYLLKDLKIKCKYYICNDGAYIMDENKNVIYKNIINPNTVNTIYSRLKNLGCKEYYFDQVNILNDTPSNEVNKILVKSNKINDNEILNTLLENLDDVYGYISNNWINIIDSSSCKESAIKYILDNNKYENIFVVGNDMNDIGMIKKYNGYFVSNENIDGYNCIDSFIKLENIIKGKI